VTQPTWKLAGGTFRRAASAARVDRTASVPPGNRVQDQSSSNRAGRTAPASIRRSCHRRCGTPQRSARSAAGRRAPAARRPNAPPAGRRPGWCVAGPGRSPWRGPGGRRNSPRLPGDRDSDRRSGCARARARQCHLPAGRASPRRRPHRRRRLPGPGKRPRAAAR
jgi:hypothetical protein